MSPQKSPKRSPNLAVPTPPIQTKAAASSSLAAASTASPSPRCSIPGILKSAFSTATPAVCEDLTHRLSRTTTVINADATSLTELREEQVDAADFFVATTQGDEDNVMTCLQAHNLGTKHCLTLIHRSDYADAISTSGLKFGIMAAVSPREATRQELMRFVTSDRYHLVRRLEGAEVLEASIAEDSPLIGKKVSEIKWPPGCVLVALINGVHASVPAADDTFEAENNLYAMVSDKAKRKFLALL